MFAWKLIMNANSQQGKQKGILRDYDRIEHIDLKQDPPNVTANKSV